MKVSELMTKEVEIVHPDDSLMEAARKMRVRDVGFLPVCDGDRLVGTITDRDLVVRSIADGVEPHTSIGRDLVTSPVVYCYDEDTVEAAARLMEQHQIRRIVVVSRKDKRLVGVVSLGDIANNGTKKTSAQVLQSVSEPTV